MSGLQGEKEDKEMAKALSYKEFIDYAMDHYEKGGDTFVECWEEREFNEYVEMFGPVTKRDALKMFRFEREMQREYAGRGY